MYKNKILSSLFLTGFLMLLSLPVEAWDCCGPLGLTAEARVAYYHPTSNRVRRVYGDGWADYQLEVSKSFRGFGFGGLFGGRDDECCGCCGGSGGFCSDLEWSLWVGVSGFSRKGESFTTSYGSGGSYFGSGSSGFNDDTRLELIPINFGVKIFYPIFCNTKFFIGGAASYSFLRIRDHSEYVHQHTRREEWGGLVQSGVTYTICDWLVVSAFFDYFFQTFDFHDTHYSSHYGSYYFYDDRFIERNELDLSGYKVGVGLGLTF